MRSPSPVLIDRQSKVLFACQFDKPFPSVEIGDEGLLTEDVFAGQQRILDQLHTIAGMRGDVNDFDAIIRQ